MPSSSETTPSTSGIQTSSSGDRYIPSSVRADGSVRKEIRIKPGYKPPEDVERYKNRATDEWRKPRGVPGAEGLKEEKNASNLTGSAAKNAKRKEARKRAATAAKEGESSTAGNEAAGAEEAKKEEVDPEVAKEKEAKKLTKKLRQARELQAKKEQGSSLLPEQFEKVIKINELIRQLDLLGFDAEGERKGDKKEET